jgi:hypothetical protein
LMVILVPSQRAGEPCPHELAQPWNKFVNSANSYIQKLQEGVVDVKLRHETMREWSELTSCGCW